uniref:ATP synthase subunit a n=1 Tax=Curculionidae sp. BMNH 1040049 TaxID=1903777 RepID=A0A343A5W7_9CUCU|nr:ATP synthase F0 subunit 6 [Curculionidae sp. BMNH 1040049]
MNNNLFSSFDPSTILFNFNWTSTLIIFLIMPSSFWLTPSRWNMIWKMINMFIHKEFKIIINKKFFMGNTFLFSSLFLFILINNFMGLFPYIFTSSSHLTFTLTLSIPLWLSFMLYGWLNNSNHMFAHLVPNGAPNLLLPFLVLVESISNIIRPGTLAIRLSANMIAGHLLLTLLGNSGNTLPMILISALLIGQFALLTLESAVSMIQSYVFSILSTLYSSEIKYEKPPLSLSSPKTLTFNFFLKNLLNIISLHKMIQSIFP